jgi:septum site-determining protein MinC
LQGEVVVKGWRNGLLLVLPPDDPWDEVVQQVEAKLDEAKARSFWRGAQTTLDCGMRIVSTDEIDTLLDRIKGAFGLVPVAIVATDDATRASGEKRGLVSYTEMPVVKKPSRSYDLPEPEKPAEVSLEKPIEKIAAPTNNALYIPGVVRSGQRIVHDGNLIIVGDVNAGAEVLAEGDVVVFGALRGLAHAGYTGNESARIVALSLRPPQLRIAGKIARSPEEEKGKAASQRGPEVARIENGEIEVSPL